LYLRIILRIKETFAAFNHGVLMFCQTIAKLTNYIYAGLPLIEGVKIYLLFE
jgi:hypothetical protein